MVRMGSYVCFEELKGKQKLRRAQAKRESKQFRKKNIYLNLRQG